MHDSEAQIAAFRTLIEGVLQLWDQSLEVTFDDGVMQRDIAANGAASEAALVEHRRLRDDVQPTRGHRLAGCKIARDGDTLATVALEASPLGRVWSVGVGGKRSRSHLCAAAALRHLRDALASDRASARVLFVDPPEQDPPDEQSPG